ATPARSATSRMLARLRTRKRFSLMAGPPCTVGPIRGLRRKDVLIDRIGGGEWSALRLLPNRPSIYAGRRVQIVESGLRCEPPGEERVPEPRDRIDPLPRPPLLGGIAPSGRERGVALPPHGPAL